MVTKVIELIPTLVSGGAETMIKDYCLLFDREKIDVHVVVIDHRYGTYNEKILEENGIRVTYLSEILYGDRLELNISQRLLRKISRYYFWRKIVLEEKPDIIHMHLHLDKYMKVLPIKRLNCHLVMTIHNVIENFFSKNSKDGDKYKEYKEVSRLVHKHNMKLIALHDDLKEELMNYFDTEDVVTINNGIMLDRFRNDLYDSDQIRKKLGIKDDEYVIGNVASMSQQKNHEFILDVFERVLQVNSKARLLLVGNGDKKEYIQNRIKESQIEDRVIILSNRGDIPELMTAMDVFFFPSKWEGFGNVMIEAQSIGLKCVVSEAIPDCTRVTDDVIVCDLQDDINKWVEALLNPDCPKDEKVCDIEQYDMRNCVVKLDELYSSLIGNL